MERRLAESLHCDLCVIGAGAGGLTLAAGASQMGAAVILVERFQGFGVRVIAEEAHFTARRRLVAGNFEIRARRYVIATGSTSHIPAIPGIEVSLVEAKTILANDDPELVAVVRQRLIAEGVALREQSNALHVEQRGENIVLSCSGANGEIELQGSHLLIAVGRTPNIDGLGLDAAGIHINNGALMLDRRLRTTNRRIFAIGDAAGPYRFTHMAAYQAGIVLRNALFRLPAKVKYQAVPWVTYCDPEIAHVGLSEVRARESGTKFNILRYPFGENDRAVAEGRPEGLTKVVVTPGGHILGASIAGAHAGELIHAWSPALSRRLKVSAMAQAITPYPTLSEVSTRAAGSYYTAKLFSPPDTAPCPLSATPGIMVPGRL